MQEVCNAVATRELAQAIMYQFEGNEAAEVLHKKPIEDTMSEIARVHEHLIKNEVLPMEGHEFAQYKQPGESKSFV